MKAQSLLVAFLFGILLMPSGCSMLPLSPEPEPLPSMAPERPTEPSHKAAVLALLDKAHIQSASGQFEDAGLSLERALRIDPRNPVLWQELARVRLEQGLYQQAENLAVKSSTLAGSNRSLKAENWRLIGQARTKRGDLRGARAAFKKAEQP